MIDTNILIGSFIGTIIGLIIGDKIVKLLEKNKNRRLIKKQAQAIKEQNKNIMNIFTDDQKKEIINKAFGFKLFATNDNDGVDCMGR